MLSEEDFASKLRYKIGKENNAPIGGANYHITENIENEVEASDVNLDSFAIQDRLADIWDDNGQLDLQVRDRLLDIADDFWDTMNIDWVEPVDIILTGSICNYNWSEFSDIDLHIVVDFSDVYDKPEFVQDYFDEKKDDWNNSHENLEIHGFPVELYVQDVNAKTESTSEYDLEANEWITKPNKNNLSPIDSHEKSIKSLASRLMTKIDKYIDLFNSEKDMHKIEELSEKVSKFKKAIHAFRKKSLKKGGEMDPGNICYKVLRRTNYIDKLHDLENKLYDKINSINERKIQTNHRVDGISIQ